MGYKTRNVIHILNTSSYHAPSHSVICKCVVTPRQKKIMCGMCRKFTHTAISRKCMKSPAQLPEYDKYTCKECKDKVTRVYIYIYICISIGIRVRIRNVIIYNRCLNLTYNNYCIYYILLYTIYY